MENSILNNLLFDPAYLIIGLGVLSLILLIAVIVCIARTKTLYKRYDAFMRGKNADSLEERILEQIEDIKNLNLEDHSNKDAIKAINKTLQKTCQKIGLVRYDAFKGMGGQSSFAFAILDQQDNGVLMNAIHSREGCYLYAKEIVGGVSEITLSKEEEAALKKALS